MISRQSLNYGLLVIALFSCAQVHASTLDCKKILEASLPQAADLNPTFGRQQTEIKSHVGIQTAKSNEIHGQQSLITLIELHAIARGAIKPIMNWDGQSPLTVFITLQRPFEVSRQTLAAPEDVVGQLGLPLNTTVSADNDGIIVLKSVFDTYRGFSVAVEEIVTQLKNYYGLRPFIQMDGVVNTNIIHTLSLAHIFKFLKLKQSDEWFLKDERYEQVFQDFLDFAIDGRVSLALLKRIYSIPQNSFSPFEIRAFMARSPNSSVEIDQEKLDEIKIRLDRKYIPASSIVNNNGQVEVIFSIKKIDDLVRLSRLFNDSLMPVFQIAD